MLEHGLEGVHMHDHIHGIVGGAMNTVISANDPIFFTHHANVDKIWNDWQTWSIAHRNAFSGFTLRNGIMPASTSSPADMLDLNNLLYTPPGGSPKVTLSVEYVDMDTSSMWGAGNTNSRTARMP